MKKSNLLLSTALLFSMLVASGCGDNSSSTSVNSSTSSLSTSSLSTSEVNDGLVEYMLTVKTVGRNRVPDVEVTIYEGETLVKKAVSNYLGVVEIKLPNKEYTVKLSNLPQGMFEKEEGYRFGGGEETEYTFELMTKVLEGKAPAGTKYKLGDLMYDFSFEDTDGNKYTLSETLKEKDLVLINFWHTLCGPCGMEFPIFDVGYRFHSDRVEYFCMGVDMPGWPIDTMDGIKDYKEENGYSFPMGKDVDNVFNYFGFSGIPGTVLVDKYGTIIYSEVGAMTSEDAFMDLLEDNLKLYK